MIRIPTTADTNRAELDAAYVRSLVSALGHLNEIHNLIHELPAPDSPGLNWEHLGALNKVKTDLRNIVNFLSGNDE